MNKLRSIEQIIAPAAPHIVGSDFNVHNVFPGDGKMTVERMSPFFLLDYGTKTEPVQTGDHRRVGLHSHHGLETVTIAYHGKVVVHKSPENPWTIEKGAVQWMTAEAGILHRKYYQAEAGKVDGEFQLVQLYVHLPAKYKKSESKQQSIRRDELGQVLLPDGKGIIEIIAGNFNKAPDPRTPFTPIEMYNARLKKGAKAHFSFPENYNTGFLIIEGAVMVNEHVANANHFVLFANDGTDIYMEATKEAVVLILSGEPTPEQIEPYSPFVVNNNQEIVDAYDDWNKGTFWVFEGVSPNNP